MGFCCVSPIVSPGLGPRLGGKRLPGGVAERTAAFGGGGGVFAPSFARADKGGVTGGVSGGVTGGVWIGVLGGVRTGVRTGVLTGVSAGVRGGVRLGVRAGVVGLDKGP